MAAKALRHAGRKLCGLLAHARRKLANLCSRRNQRTRAQNCDEGPLLGVHCSHARSYICTTCTCTNMLSHHTRTRMHLNLHTCTYIGTYVHKHAHASISKHGGHVLAASLQQSICSYAAHPRAPRPMRCYGCKASIAECAQRCALYTDNQPTPQLGAPCSISVPHAPFRCPMPHSHAPRPISVPRAPFQCPRPHSHAPRPW